LMESGACIAGLGGRTRKNAIDQGLVQPRLRLVADGTR
jgi:hypothetical protein